MGSNFGAADSSVHVSIGGTEGRESLWVADSSLKCSVANGVAPGRVVALSVSSLTGTGTGLLSFNSPVLSSLMLRNGPLSGRSTLSIVGSQLGFESSSPAIQEAPSSSFAPL